MNESARCLSIHEHWTCRHTGACCRAGWAIPVEGPAFERLRVHFGRERELFVTGGPLPEGAAAVLATSDDGTCGFYEGRLCAIHRQLGPESLPVACQQFPRQVLRDGRGIFITLSHYCPTAAKLLLDRRRLAIVDAPPSLALNGAVEGLDARDVMPPLLRPDLLTDLEGYGEWERQAIAVLDSDACGGADAAIERIDASTRVVTEWTPDGGSLKDTVVAAFESTKVVAAGDQSVDTLLRRYDLARRAVPAGLTRPHTPPARELAEGLPALCPAHDRVVRAYLASRLFGNWIAYSAPGLLAVVNYLRVCLAVLRVELVRQSRSRPGTPVDESLLEAIRRSDLLLVHHADARRLAHAVSQS